MKPFKFLTNPIAYTINKEPIYAGEVFFTMNKEEMVAISGGILPKHIIIHRYVSKTHQYKFNPDYNKLLYFKTRESAEFYKERLKHWEEHIENRQ